MIFKITFIDGSVETVHASNPGEARRFAIQEFLERIVAEVQPAGLTDMVNRRPKAMHESPRQGIRAPESVNLGEGWCGVDNRGGI